MYGLIYQNEKGKVVTEFETPYVANLSVICSVNWRCEYLCKAKVSSLATH